MAIGVPLDFSSLSFFPMKSLRLLKKSCILNRFLVQLDTPFFFLVSSLNPYSFRLPIVLTKFFLGTAATIATQFVLSFRSLVEFSSLREHCLLVLFSGFFLSFEEFRRFSPLSPLFLPVFLFFPLRNFFSLLVSPLFRLLFLCRPFPN